jgi:hypothetical protein
MKGVDRLVVDTTATATFHMKEGVSPTKESLNEILGKVAFKPAVATLEKVVRPRSVATFEIDLKGLG